MLIIDDAPSMRMMLEDMLSKSYHKVLQAKDGAEGLEIIKRQKVDVCTRDIMMPGMDGLEVLERIKKDYPDIRVIMLSARCGEDTVRRALELGADFFVAKPFQTNCLLDRI